MHEATAGRDGLLRPLRVAVLLVATLAVSAEARTFECTTTDGVYRAPGNTRLSPAGKRDPTIIGNRFTVASSGPSVRGSSLFDTEGKKIEVLRDTADAYELLWRNKHADIFALQIQKFQSAWTFSYYAGWHGLLLAGQCRPL